jgi:hypothetical protein
MDDARVLNLLTNINRWWEGEPVPKSITADHKRRDFYVLRGKLQQEDGIVTIRGPRQVGKTTVVGQLIESVLERADPRRVLYLNIENSQILSESGDIIRKSLELYENNILGVSFQRLDHPVYVFIDEIQKAPGWASVLKYYTDTYANLKFVVTGSVSTLIDSDAEETLVGRLDRFTMYPMKYIEYVRYDETLPLEEINDLSNEMRDSFCEGVVSGDRSKLNEAFMKMWADLSAVKAELTALKNRYLLRGGYPGILGIDENVDVLNKLDEDIRDIVRGDVPSVFPVQKPEKALHLLNLLVESSGSKFSRESAADAIGASRELVENYLGYLEEFYLVNPTPQYSSSEYNRRGGLPKYYLQDVGFYNTLNGTLSERTLRDEERLGPILETVVRDHLGRLQYHLSGHRTGAVEYWDANGEVDFVLSGADYLLPVEVKNGDSTKTSLRGMHKFLDETDAPFGIVVNNAGVFDDEGDIFHVPAWFFFFIC